MDTVTNSRNEFASCPKCKFVWNRRGAFLVDPSTEIISYFVNFDDLDRGYFVFKHNTCGATLKLQVLDFKDLYSGHIHSERKTGTENCPEYCLNPDELHPCPEECECAYAREIIQLISTPSY